MSIAPTFHPALLPNGLSDLLPPKAGMEARLVHQLLEFYQSCGFPLVKPPLMEFEEGLFTGPGAVLARQSFRLMDPVSQRMMGLRPDMTAQIARIVGTRLKDQPRPLRLSYAGDVVRVRGTQLRPERQFSQVGAELVGSLLPSTDAEMILMAVEALGAIGIGELSVDLCLPTLLPSLAEAADMTGQAWQELADAADHRDSDAVARIGGKIGDFVLALLDAIGEVALARPKLEKLRIPAVVKSDFDRLFAVLDVLARDAVDLPVSLTIDAIERRGFEYQTGLSFTLLSRSVRGELGRGGRYRTWRTDGAASKLGEPAVGFTLYTDSLLRARADQTPVQQMLAPFDASRADIAGFRRDGWIVVQAIEPSADIFAEAIRQGCSHVMESGKPRPVG